MEASVCAQPWQAIAGASPAAERPARPLVVFSVHLTHDFCLRALTHWCDRCSAEIVDAPTFSPAFPPHAHFRTAYRPLQEDQELIDYFYALQGALLRRAGYPQQCAPHRRVRAQHCPARPICCLHRAARTHTGHHPRSEDDRTGEPSSTAFQRGAGATAVPDVVPVAGAGADWREFR